MFIEIGFFSLCLASVFALYAAIASVLCLINPNHALVDTSRNAIIACFFCVLLSSASLWHAIFYHDFSIQYVFAHSAVDMPPFYLFTSFWSALEGSHLLWTLLLSTVCAVTVVCVRKTDKLEYLPAVCFAFSICLIFMLMLNLTVSRPFELAFPTNQIGLGMNALLQNPYMAIHPPMLFLGYSLLIVPFAYGFAALLKGSITSTWRATIRRFTLVAWAILTIAIFLGGKWAYVVLGWGGYRGWDPVENASFMPWLATTAFLHTLLIYERTKKLPRLTVFLAMFAFVLTFFGTFLTRSGVISSVHSFAESSIGPSYLLWIVFLCVATCLLVFMRGHFLQEKQSFEPFHFSKEAILLFTNYFLLFLLAIVFFGTILPLVVEAISGSKISIQQPFYNAFAPWIGLCLVSLLGVGNVAKWKSARLERPGLSIGVPLCIAFLLTVIFYFIKHFEFKTGFVYFLVMWTIFVLILDFVHKLKNTHWNGFEFLKYQRPYFGALIAHIGFLIAILGFSGYPQTVAYETNLKLNQSTEFEGFRFTNQGLSFNQSYNEKKITASIQTENLYNRNTFKIEPARTKFTNNPQWFNEVGVHSTVWFDLYCVIMSFDTQDQSVALKINYNPMVKFVWTSVVVMVLGSVIAWTGRARRIVPVVKINNKKNQIRLSVLIILCLLLLTIFGFSGLVNAQEMQTQQNTEQAQIQKPLNEQQKKEILDIETALRCPTCLGMSIVESDTPQSVAMRHEVEQMVRDGKTKTEIVDYFKEHYGAWILRAPDVNTMLGKILWGIPILGLIVGPFILLWRLKPKK